MKVKELMKEAYIIDKDISLNDAASIMSSKDVSSLILYIKDDIKGIVTEKDLLQNFGKKAKISEIMTKKVLSVDSESEVSAALAMMKEFKKKKLPVIEKGKLVGIINLIDIAINSDEIGDDFFFN